MPRKKIKFSFKPFFIIAGIVLAVFLLLSALADSARDSDYFQIKEVIASSEEGKDFSYLKGENIFSLDLNKESRYILEHYPAYRSIRLVRILPDRLYIQFIKRYPAAVVRLYRNFYVDRYGVLFYPPEEGIDTNLPVITGIETKIFGPKPGKKYDTRELKLALEIINFCRFNRVIRRFRIKRIDARDLKDISLFLSPAVENTGGNLAEGSLIQVKFNQSELKERIGTLASILANSQKELPQIKYIDLRYKDPVIKMRE